MKNIAIAILGLFIVAGVSAGNKMNMEDDTNRSVGQDKNSKKAKSEAAFKQMAQVLENREFVLEADYLSNQYGDRITVTSTLNFIKVDSTSGVIQVGSNSGVGYNGVGGVTAEGNITKYELDKNEKKNTFFIQMTVMTSIGTYDVNLSVGANGYATATVSGLRRGRLNYSGSLVPLQATRTYEGTTSF
jgi:hypothetical protein